MCSARCIFAFITPILCYCHMLMMEPILAEHLNDKGFTTMQIGLFFTIFPANYMLSSFMIQYIPTQIVLRLRLMFGAVINCIGFLMVGPSTIFHFPDSIILMAMG